jgi:hypothetical protein
MRFDDLPFLISSFASHVPDGWRGLSCIDVRLAILHHYAASSTDPTDGDHYGTGTQRRAPASPVPDAHFAAGAAAKRGRTVQGDQ